MIAGLVICFPIADNLEVCRVDKIRTSDQPAKPKPSSRLTATPLCVQTIVALPPPPGETCQVSQVGTQ